MYDGGFMKIGLSLIDTAHFNCKLYLSVLNLNELRTNCKYTFPITIIECLYGCGRKNCEYMCLSHVCVCVLLMRIIADFYTIYQFHLIPNPPRPPSLLFCRLCSIP